MIDARGVTKSFGLRQALAGVDLVVAPGEWVTLVGPNGAGKTTLLRILATLARPTAGSVRIAGLDPAQAGAEVRGQIGFLSHRTLLYDDLTAAQNLAFYARAYGLLDADARITELLSRVNLDARRHDLVRTFSRGMQQRLSVARAVLHRPRLLLLDEPYTGLDPLAADTLTALLEDMAGAGCTVLLTTHDLDRRFIAGRRVVVLHRGRMVHAAIPADPAAFPALYRALVTTQPSPRHPVTPSPRHPVTPSPPLPLPSFLHQIAAILRKDLAAEWRTRELFSAMAVFAIMALLIFSFALELRGAVARAVAPGVLWTIIAFAGTLGLNRSLAREQQTGGLEGMLLAPFDRVAIFFGKALGNLILMLAVEAVLTPLATALLNVPLLHPGILLTLLLGTVGYAAVGTLLAAIAVNTRAREVLLPILLLPLTVPLLIAAVQAMGGWLDGAPDVVSAWTRLLVAYTLVILAVSMATFGYVLEE